LGAYLDASAILSTLIDEPRSVAVDGFIAAVSEPLVISEFAAAEVASALSRLVRTRIIDPEDAAARLSDFDAWRATAATELDFQASDMRLAQVYVRRFDLRLRAPDALHAAACRRAGHSLVTLDRRLAFAAEALGLGVIFLR